MKKVYFIIFILLMFSCSDDSTNPSEDQIVGKWEKEVNIENDNAIMIIDFKDNGDYFVYRIDEGDLDLAQTGTYTIENDNIKMTDDGCDEIIGEYRLEFSDNQIKFITINDECERAIYVRGTYDKTEEVLTIYAA